MSCEDDDYGRDDPEPIIEVKKINVCLTTITREHINKIEKGLSLCLDRKLNKLNLLLKQMNVYLVNGTLVINDKYKTTLNFIDTVNAFGMDIKEVKVDGFKGKTYLISDKIIKLLHVLGANYDWSSEVEIKTLPQVAKINFNDLFEYKELDKVYNSSLKKYLSKIRSDGSLFIEGQETFIDGISQGVVSNSKEVEVELQNYLSNSQHEACTNNRNVQYGTTEILYERARQMGYSVEKTVENDEVQLVLVRLN